MQVGAKVVICRHSAGRRKGCDMGATGVKREGFRMGSHLDLREHSPLFLAAGIHVKGVTRRPQSGIGKVRQILQRLLCVPALPFKHTKTTGGGASARGGKSKTTLMFGNRAGIKLQGHRLHFLIKINHRGSKARIK